jgi:hypothetical protein
MGRLRGGTIAIAINTFFDNVQNAFPIGGDGGPLRAHPPPTAASQGRFLVVVDSVSVFLTTGVDVGSVGSAGFTSTDFVLLDVVVSEGLGAGAAAGAGAVAGGGAAAVGPGEVC